MRYFLSKDECELLPLVSVKLGGLRTTLQLLLPSTPTTSQLTTQNKHKPQGNLNFLQTFSRGRQLGSFLVFFESFWEKAVDRDVWRADVLLRRGGRQAMETCFQILPLALSQAATLELSDANLFIDL